MILIDTSGLIALLDRGEPDHQAATAALERERGPLVLTDFVLAEADYLILRRLGRNAERDFVAQLVDGVFSREAPTDADLRRAQEILERFAGVELGLADATLMALAERLRIRRVLTLDRRHFAPYRDRRGQPLELLPG